MISDFFGVTFNRGDTIAYPLRQGSKLWIETAEVTNVKATSLDIKKSNGNKTTIKNYKNCIIAPEGWSPEDG